MAATPNKIRMYYEDPELALANYNREGMQAWGSDQYLLDYIQDQASISDVVFDIETTELIDEDQTLIADMDVSVASALVLGRPSEPGGTFQRRLQVFWNNPATGRGAPIRFLIHLLDHAARIVAYNGYTFDLVVLARGDAERLGHWRSKLFDPYRILLRSFSQSFKLDTLLKHNGLDPKTGTGVDAVAMWKRWTRSRDARELETLQVYNERDTSALAALVMLQTVWVPGRGQTSAVSLR